MHYWIWSRNYSLVFSYCGFFCLLFGITGYKLSLTIIVVLFPYVYNLTEQQLGFSIVEGATIDINQQD
jgi:hypothetical protein